MITEEQIRSLIEALYDQGVECEKLLQVIFRLSTDRKKDVVINAFQSMLPETPVEVEDCVLFGTIVLKFDSDGRLIDIFKAVAGTTKRAEILMGSSSDL